MSEEGPVVEPAIDDAASSEDTERVLKEINETLVRMTGSLERMHIMAQSVIRDLQAARSLHIPDPGKRTEPVDAVA